MSRFLCCRRAQAVIKQVGATWVPKGAITCSMVAASPMAYMLPLLPLTLKWSSVMMDLKWV